MDTKLLVPTVKRQWEELKGIRNKWIPEWQDVIDYVARKNIDLTQTLRDPKSKPRVLPTNYDTTALESAKMVRYGLHGYTCSQSLDWLKLKTEREDAAELPGMRQWLTDCEKHLYSVLENSNWYEAIGESIFDAVTLGTTLIYPEENEDLNGINFSIKDISEFAIAENSKGEVDTVLRRFAMPLYRAADKFPDLPQELMDKLENNSSESIVFIHAVFPSKSKDYKKCGLDQKWAYCSVYILETNVEWTHVGGYDTKPYAVWRWEKRSGEVYGKSPALDSMADVKIMNQMSKTMLRAAHKSVDPPYAVIGKSQVPDMAPGREIRVPDRNDVPVLLNATGPGYQLASDQFARVSLRITKQFNANLFLMLEQSAQNPMTAREVIERQGEKAAILGAIVSRMSSELLDPVMDRIWAIEMQAQRLPPMPQELAQAIQAVGVEAANLRIDYQGPLAQAQKKYHETNGIQQILAAVAPWAQMRPDLLDNFKLDEMFRVLAGSNGMQENLIEEQPKIDQLRKQRAQQQQQQAAQQQQMMMAELAAKTGKAPEPGSPGQAVMDSAGAGNGR